MWNSNSHLKFDFEKLILRMKILFNSSYFLTLELVKLKKDIFIEDFS